MLPIGGGDVSNPEGPGSSPALLVFRNSILKQGQGMILKIIAGPGTGQVDDFAPQFADHLLASGRGVRIDPPVVVGIPKVQAAIVPPAEAAVLAGVPQVQFQRGPSTFRR